MYTASSSVRCEITVKRPNGTVEIVVLPNDGRIGAVKFQAMKAATLAAGRGELMSYNNIAPEYQMTEADKAAREYEQHAKKMAAMQATSISR